MFPTSAYFRSTLAWLRKAVPARLFIALCIAIIPVAILHGQARVWFGLRIIKGEPTTIAKHPWQVAIVVRHSGGSALCSGSIVSTGWLLTAAHCFPAPTGAADVKIKAGADDFLRQGDWLDASKIKIHPQYASTNQVNDIALVKLSSIPNARIIPFADDLQPPAPEGQPLEIAGWGASDLGGGPSSELRRAIVDLVGKARCNAPDGYNGSVGVGKICAGDSEADACQGDSGGPLIWYQPRGPMLVGVVSSGEGCGNRMRFGIYTDVAYYSRWIKDSILAD